MRRFITIVLFTLLPSLSLAQVYPDYTSTTVNDFAGLLDETQEAKIATQLSDLRQNIGVEMTVVTLSRQETYAPDMSLEEFATGLFNHWGIGDKTRNDGILVLILREDRAMRIELGGEYGHTWDRSAENVVQGSFLPSFRDGNYPKGIALGVNATIEQIAKPFHGGAEAPTPPKRKNTGTKSDFFGKVWVYLISATVIGLIFGRKITDFMARLQTCSSCGRRGGLRITRSIQKPATTTLSGSGLKTMFCAHCDFHRESSYMISPRSNSRSSSGGGFGGGSSGGGGASGRW